MYGRYLATLLVCGALASGALSARAADADPYGIFAHARTIFSQQRYPQYLTYTVAVRVTERGVDKAKHYHLAYDAKDAKIYVNPVSDEERVAPPDPYGVTFHLVPKRQYKTLIDKRVGNPGEAVDYLGIPMISPTYSFGMSDDASETGDNPDALVQEIRKEFKDPTPPAKARELLNDPKMRTIAIVTGYHRRYIVTLDGIENVDGRACYHLSLKPNDPSPKLRLRELWIDAQTYETRKLVSSANFTGSAVPWAITFDDVNGALYIASEAALAPVGVGDHRYEQASVSFENIAPSDTPPTGVNGWFVTKENIMTEPASGPAGP